MLKPVPCKKPIKNNTNKRVEPTKNLNQLR